MKYNKWIFQLVHGLKSIDAKTNGNVFHSLSLYLLRKNPLIQILV